MSKKSTDEITELYQLEREAELAKHGRNQRRPLADRRERPSLPPHTPASNAGPEMTTSSPSFGTKGRSATESLEITAKPENPSSERVHRLPSKETPESQLLDAYWASFGAPSTRALMRSATKMGSVLEVVIGTDEREEVSATANYPWRTIASLLIAANDGTSWIGTGWFVGPRILLTAGHCVYMEDHGGWAREIEVIPGRQGSTQPYGSVVATDFRSVTGWTKDRNRDYDYAAILLPATNRLGDQLGWFGYEIRADDDFEDLLVNLSGYPGDKPSGTQWFSKNKIADVDERVLTYEIDTAGGQSGAPVWVKKSDGSRYSVGIHTNGDITGNSATRITQEVFDNIGLWKAEVP